MDMDRNNEIDKDFDIKIDRENDQDIDIDKNIVLPSVIIQKNNNISLNNHQNNLNYNNDPIPNQDNNQDPIDDATHENVSPYHSPIPTSALPEKKAKILLLDGNEYYIEGSCIIGRSSNGPKQPDIIIGDKKTISRYHLYIHYDAKSNVFSCTCLSRNGAFIDGNFIFPRNRPVVLSSRSLIQISDLFFYFLLPAILPVSTSLYHVNLLDTSLEPKTTVDLSQIIYQPWRRSERDRLRQVLLSFGWGRWHLIAEKMKVARPLLDILSFSLQFLLRIIELCPNCEVKNGLQTIYLRTEKSGYVLSQGVNDPLLLNWAVLKKQCYSWGKRLVILYDLKQAIEILGIEQLLSNVTRVRGRLPAVWWSEMDDLHLLKGIWTHGYGNLETIRIDPSLSFHNRTILVENHYKRRHVDIDNEDDNEEEVEKIEAVNEMEPENEHEESELPPESKDNFPEMKEKDFNLIDRYTTTESPNRSQSIIDNLSNEQPDSLPDTLTTDSTSAPLYIWPSSLQLYSRVKRLIESIRPIIYRSKNASHSKRGRIRGKRGRRRGGRKRNISNHQDSYIDESQTEIEVTQQNKSPSKNLLPSNSIHESPKLTIWDEPTKLSFLQHLLQDGPFYDRLSSIPPFLSQVPLDQIYETLTAYGNLHQNISKDLSLHSNIPLFPSSIYQRIIERLKFWQNIIYVVTHPHIMEPLISASPPLEYPRLPYTDNIQILKDIQRVGLDYTKINSLHQLHYPIPNNQWLITRSSYLMECCYTLDLDLSSLSYPIQLSPTLVLLNLGRLFNHPHHYPVGYSIQNFFPSPDLTTYIWYQCDIAYSSHGPLFQININGQQTIHFSKIDSQNSFPFHLSSLYAFNHPTITHLLQQLNSINSKQYPLKTTDQYDLCPLFPSPSPHFISQNNLSLPGNTPIHYFYEGEIEQILLDEKDKKKESKDPIIKPS